MNTRRDFLKLTGLGAISAALFPRVGKSADLAFQALETAAARKPNIVLMLADDLGWGDIGYHGGQAKTPNLDRISAAGMRLERFYVQPICTPTRSALMTGRYAWRTGMASGVILNNMHYGLPLDETTLGQVMKSADYATYIVGKWHVGHETPAYLPTERGFDYHYGLYTAIDHFTHMWQGGLDWHRNRKPVHEKGYSVDLLGEDCVRVIKGHDFSKQPLFLYHPTFAVHGPHQAPEKYTAPYADVKDSKRRALLGLCAAMDYQFGQIIQALEKAGQLNNTLVFFTSDNGGDIHVADNKPLRGGKATYYEGGLRVPAFAYWPGKIKGGQTTEALAHVTDLLPTFGKLAGAKMPVKPLDGFDLAPVLFGGAATSGRKEIVFILDDTMVDRRGSIIDWPWKLLRTETDAGVLGYELFDIEKDPGEKLDGAATARAHPEITERLSKRLDELKKEAPPALCKKGDSRQPKGWKASPIIGPDQD